jgi:poly-gamma-glutamate capsule biosynthesis protein CapA/YwtB (metallophosphatase superfamily)
MSRPRLISLTFSCFFGAASAALGGDSDSGTVKLIFVGDIMVAHDEETGKLITQGVDPFQPFAALLKDADIAVGNLECVVAEKGERVRKPYNFLADPRCLPSLKQHFTAFTVANNHSGDFGKGAFVEQCDRLEKAGIPYFGGGRNKADAHKPWIVDRNGVRIAMLGYCEVYLPSFQAEENVPGVAWSEHDEEVLTDVRAAHAKYKADVVIPFMHWGDENDPPTDRQKSFARKMIDAGADVVVGAHPHVTQGAEYYRDHLIVYSLGNFLFNGFDDEECQTGWALRLSIDKHGVLKWDTVVARLDDHGVPHPDLSARSPRGVVEPDEIVSNSEGAATAASVGR